MRLISALNPTLLSMWLKLLFLAGLGTVVNSLKTFASVGVSPTTQMQLLAQTAAINATTNFDFTLTGPDANIHQGWVRIHGINYPGAGAGVVSGIKIVGNPAGTARTLYMDTTTRTASDVPDLIIPFLADIDITVLRVSITMTNVANGQLALDLELCGNR